MLRWCAVVAATCVLAACPSFERAPSRPAPPDDAPLRIRVAQAEVRRAGGAAELIELAAHGARPARLLALRGLGRIGATATDATGASPAIRTLLGALGDPDAEIVGAAAGALGVAASLDDGELAATDALIAALPRGGGPVIEALGRAGTPAAQPVIVAALADPKLAELAALALGRHGRRKLALSEPSRRALVAATAVDDPAVRYAAVYALAREHEPPADPAVVTALVHRLADASPETRAQAIAGLARRKAVAAARADGARVDAMLLDRDWRVAVEAVRALSDTDDGRDAIASALVRRHGELARGDATAAHVVIEGLRALAGAAARPVVATALTALTAPGAAHASLPPLTRGWIECLAISARVRAEPEPAFAAVEQCPLADPLRLPIIAELITANVGSLAARRAAFARLANHAEPRVRAAAVTALPALWKAGEPADRRDAQKTWTAALASPDPGISGAALDAATALYDAIGAGDHAWLDSAVIARAATERDPELGPALLELIGKRALTAGAGTCRAALAEDPARAKAAASCLKALGETVAAPPAAAPAVPPVDVSAVIGQRLRWRITTSRGDIVIRLAPEVAPWAVATIVALTRKGYYNGLAFHRVVPNFVVQGGDPTESGSGGPGFAIPAEPATLTDGTGYQVGGTGIADAGRDTGGSQWFIMHSRAPHLDGRYTWIGAVDSGQKAADALLVGDRILRATVEVVP